MMRVAVFRLAGNGEGKISCPPITIEYLKVETWLIENGSF
jgi:hypothetical protein